MITGAHAIVYSEDAEADRAFFRDVLKFDHVDAGGGWLIFALPPAELAVHPGAEKHQLYLMCDDIHATAAELDLTSEITDQGWGLVTAIRLPGGGELGLYEPKHPTPR
jgi:hypothetical protein